MIRGSVKFGECEAVCLAVRATGDSLADLNCASSRSHQGVPDKGGSSGGRGPDGLVVSEVCGERRAAGPLL